MTDRLAELVLLACHDLRTPLATVRGFAATLAARGELGEREREWVAAVETSSLELGDLLDLLGRATRVAGGTYEPVAATVDLGAVAEEVAERLGRDRVAISVSPSPDGGPVEAMADRDDVGDALHGLARCLLEHGGLDAVTVELTPGRAALWPVADGVGPIALGEELRDLRAAIGVELLRAGGAVVAIEGDRLSVAFAGAAESAG